MYIHIVPKSKWKRHTLSSVCLFFSFWQAEKKPKHIHFSVPLDNICHSSPQAYSDWACRVNRSKRTQISQGGPGTQRLGGGGDRGESRMRLFFFYFRQGRGLLLARLSHSDRRTRHEKLMSARAGVQVWRCAQTSRPLWGLLHASITYLFSSIPSKAIFH